jgi:hypothetical protein
MARIASSPFQKPVHQMDAIVDPHADDHGKDDGIDEINTDPKKRHRSHHPDETHDQRYQCEKSGSPFSEMEKDQ